MDNSWAAIFPFSSSSTWADGYPAQPQDCSSFPDPVLGPCFTLEGGREEGRQILNYARKLYVTRKIFIFLKFQEWTAIICPFGKPSLTKKNPNPSLGAPGKVNGPRVVSVVFFMSRYRISRQGPATAVCLLVLVIAPWIRPSVSSLQWLSLQRLGGLLSPGLGALCGEVSSRDTALAGHRGWERVGTPEDCPGLKAELSSAALSSSVLLLHSNLVGPRPQPPLSWGLPGCMWPHCPAQHLPWGLASGFWRC